MGKFSDQEIDEIFEGETVFELLWDSGAPGAGAGSELVLKYEGRFYLWNSSYELGGPFDSLSTALEAGEQPLVTGATVHIRSAELPADALANRARIAASPGHSVEINGEVWVVTEENRLARS